VTSQTVSIGVATTGPEEFSLPEVLIADADKSMFESKSLGALLRKSSHSSSYAFAEERPRKMA